MNEMVPNGTPHPWMHGTGLWKDMAKMRTESSALKKDVMSIEKWNEEGSCVRNGTTLQKNGVNGNGENQGKCEVDVRTFLEEKLKRNRWTPKPGK